MYEILIFIQFAGVMIGFANLIIVGLQKSSENQKILLIASSCAFISIISYLFEMRATGLEEMMLAVKFGYIGKCYMLLLMIMFARNYCNIKMPPVIVKGLFTFNTFMLLIILTCDYHTFYYTDMQVVNTGFFPHVQLGRGPGYYLFMAVTICMVLYYAFITFSQFLKRTGYERKRLFLLMLAGILPVLMLILYLSGILKEFDPTPFGIILSCTLLTINVINYGLLDTLQLARENAVENSKDGLLLVDPSYNLIYFNKAAKEVFPKLDSGEDINELISWIFQEGEREAVLNIDNKNYEIRVSSLMEDASLKGYLAWIFDMSFINQYTEEMIHLKQEAERANEAKSVFLAHMSHEIRTPMNAIMGFSSLALKNDDILQIKEQLHYIYNSAQTLLNIINELLDISKIELGKLELSIDEYSTKELFFEVISMIQSQINTDLVHFRFEIPSDMPKTLRGDSTRIREIIINLLNNAVKYTKEGFIYFKVIIEKTDSHVISLAFQIEDTGIGIKREDHEKVFGMFARFDKRNTSDIEGSGLGLAIVKNFIELMGGSISFSSEYGEGTTFYVRFDQEIADASPMGGLTDFIEESATVRSLKLKNCKALIVDDNQVNLLVTKELLRQYHVESDTVQGGAEALEAVKQFSYDVIFLDHMMPDMDGVETLRRMRQQREYIKNTPIVALTANALIGVKEKLLAEGFDDYLAKPILNNALEKILMRYFGDDTLDSQDSGCEPEPSLQMIKAELEQIGIDMETGLLYCSNMLTIYQEILNIAVETYQEKCSKLKTLYVNGDYKNYVIEVHGLKSSMKIIGANKLGMLAGQQEQDLHHNRMGHVTQNHDHIIKDYYDIVYGLYHFLQKQQWLREDLSAADIEKIE